MQRPTKQKRGRNKIEKDFQAWLKQRPCCVSGWHGVSVHHMYGSAFMHNKLLIGHLACIPLHYDFHQGEHGIHTISIPVWTGLHGSQASLFEKEAHDYQNETGIELPYAEYSAILDWGR